jgi:hypothetical protein
MMFIISLDSNVYIDLLIDGSSGHMGFVSTLRSIDKHRSPENKKGCPPVISCART